MSQRWPGGVISKTPPTPSGPYQSDSAPGIWTLEQATNYIKQGIWPTAGNRVPYGELWSWGYNQAGQLGLGNTTYYSSPKQIGALTTWKNISVRTFSSLAIKTDGTLWSWGRNDIGQLGLGNITYRSSPVQVGALTNWLQVSASGEHSLAVKTDGTLWSWGSGQFGKLGLGNTSNFSSPKQVGSLTNWLSVSAGAYFSIAVKTDGTLWSWGRGLTGALGLGNSNDYNSPKQVGALTNWAAVKAGAGSTGGDFSIAVKTDGTLWSWGYNASGQLGSSTYSDRSSPVQVGALTNWTSNISAGGSTVFVIKTNGALWGWGSGSVGVLGLGNTATYYSPKQIGSLTDWSKIAVGTNRATLAIKTDGTLWTWGYAQYGALGRGNTTNYSSPQQLGSLTSWINVSSGYSTALATKS